MQACARAPSQINKKNLEKRKKKGKEKKETWAL